jgi:hypothetical protein
MWTRSDRGRKIAGLNKEARAEEYRDSRLRENNEVLQLQFYIAILVDPVSILNLDNRCIALL